MFVIGFTVTKTGMTYYQKMSLKTMTFWKYGIDIVHHGDCVGADEEAHYTVKQALGTYVVVHPPKSKEKQAFCEGDEHREPKGYLERDGCIVDETECLVATPKTMSSERGGTWYTINYAKMHKKPVYVITPNGSIEFFNKEGLRIALEI